MRICLGFNSNIPFIGQLDFASSWLDFSANLLEITGEFLFPFSVSYLSWLSQVKDGLDIFWPFSRQQVWSSFRLWHWRPYWNINFVFYCWWELYNSRPNHEMLVILFVSHSSHNRFSRCLNTYRRDSKVVGSGRIWPPLLSFLIYLLRLRYVSII